MYFIRAHKKDLKTVCNIHVTWLRVADFFFMAKKTLLSTYTYWIDIPERKINSKSLKANVEPIVFVTD